MVEDNTNKRVKSKAKARQQSQKIGGDDDDQNDDNQKSERNLERRTRRSRTRTHGRRARNVLIMHHPDGKGVQKRRSRRSGPPRYCEVLVSLASLSETIRYTRLEF
ncbi:MAG: hypothetical protein Q9184_002459 [Pyrenodesmia sp. 2 TL-2023]